MSRSDRWPVHPAPIDGEALSCWLRRIAADYQMSVAELIEHGLDQGPKLEPDLDVNPPASLLDRLATSTGVAAERVARMCLAGWKPWLLDGLDPDPDGFDTYVRQFSVLLKPGKRPRHPGGPWVAWISREPVLRACPRCVEDHGRSGVRLIGQLPLMLSCADHGLMLEPCFHFPSTTVLWKEATGPRSASEAVLALDRRTAQALSTGQVELPDRTVHAGVWLRLLRALLDEVSTPVTYWGSRAADLHLVWDSCGHPVRAGTPMWRPYEAFPWPIQAQLLEAVAQAVRLLEDGSLPGRGNDAGLFFPVYEPVDDGRPPTAASKLRSALEEALRAAREDPAQAQALHDLLVGERRTPERLKRVRTQLAELGVPTAHIVTKANVDPVCVT